MKILRGENKQMKERVIILEEKIKKADEELQAIKLTMRYIFKSGRKSSGGQKMETFIITAT